MLLVLFSCISLTVFAQQLDLSLSTGTGKSYIFESTDRTVNVKYSMPLSLMTELKFTPKGHTWGIKLRLHHLESSVKGENWMDGTALSGYIRSQTSSLLLENEVTKRKSSYGFNFGIGFTQETILPQQFIPYIKNSKQYASITVGGHLSYRLRKELDFQMQPGRTHSGAWQR